MERSFRQSALLVLGVNFAVAMLAVVVCECGGKNHFRESGYVTIFSSLQLLVIAWLNYRILGIRGAGREGPLWRHSSAVWALFCFGFFFLALDEQFKIHENIDEFIHEAFEMHETNLTDRIDDAIVGLYALAAVGFLLYFRKEVLRVSKARPLFVLGFLLLFVTASIDAFTNRDNLLRKFLDREQILLLKDRIFYVEESAKIFGEAAFLLAFQAIYLGERGLVKGAADPGES